jgi:cytochrome c556
MSRIALAALLGLLGATAVLGAPEAIAERKKLMKENGAATRLGVQMVRGDVPFDLAKARAIFATYQKAGEQIPSLFPEDSKAGEETAAAPKTWQDMAGLKERAAQLAGDAGPASRSVQDLETFKAALQGVTKNCDACHQVYRIKKS